MELLMDLLTVGAGLFLGYIIAHYLDDGTE